MPTLAVAVCLDRLSPALPEALGALGRSVEEPIVAAAGLSAAELVALRQLVGRTAPGARIVESEAGLAQARNAALAACGAEVLALLDDDVAVPRGWPAALRAAWEGAPEDRATLGGPIALRLDGPRPHWLADGLLVALAPLDYGSDAVAVDAAVRTFHGGNVSFRTAALRGVGGFWPSRGSERDWFSEEHHAQRELAAAGWTAEYRPELRVERIVRTGELRRRELVARRARYGGRAQLVGGRRRSASEALLSAATGAAGAGLALVRGDTATAAERAARAAESAGAVAAPLVAHGGLQPAAPSTPFRPSVPAAQRRLPRLPAWRRGESPRAIALLYHRIADVEHDPLGLAVAPSRFAEQVEALGSRVVALERLAAGDFPDGAVALTFDDGYADNLPALRDVGVPVTLFVSTGHVGGGRTFWWDELARLLGRGGGAARLLTVRLGADERSWPARDAAQREVARRGLHAWLQVRREAEIQDALAQVRAWAGAVAGGDPMPLTLDELRALAGRDEVAIGAHTRTHPSLRWLPPEAQRAEIEGSRDDLAGWLGAAPKAFSYPFGVPGRDVDDTTRRIVAEAGFRCAVVNEDRVVEPGGDPHAIPRFVAPDLPGDAFEAWLAQQMIRR